MIGLRVGGLELKDGGELAVIMREITFSDQLRHPNGKGKERLREITFSDQLRHTVA